jgi:leader peptidase (prepilin peptidase) / N-methyltransferase
VSLAGVAFISLVAATYGSFIGAMVTRWPNLAGMVRGRSQCDGCAHRLGIADLVPVFSYVSLKGRCRTCRNPIDGIQLSAELLAVAIILWAALVMPTGSIIFLVTCMFGWLLLPLALIDWRHLTLPDPMVLLLFTVGVGVAWSFGSERFVHHLAGAAAGALGLACLAALYRCLRGRHGLGWGDVKLLGAIGIWVSWEGLPGVLLIAAVCGLIVALTRLYGFRTEEQHYPLGTFLAFGAWIVWLYGPLGFS